MPELTYRQAINEALADALAADEDVFLVGEDIGAAGGVFKVTEGLWERFGDQRVRDTPISEQAIVGLAIGAAIQGLRPVAELMFADFAAVAFDQLANQLAKYRYMTGGQVSLPVTVRLANGAGGGFGSQHSQGTENWFVDVPGLKVVAPSTVADAYGLMRASVSENDPVLFFEHKGLFGLKEKVPDELPVAELGSSAIARTGTDVTVVAYQMMFHRAAAAAEELAADGVSVELIDPRTLIPLDLETIAASVERTARLVVVQEAPPQGNWGSALIAEVARANFESLDAPPAFVSGDPTPIPYAAKLEAAWIPDIERIASAIRGVVDY